MVYHEKLQYLAIEININIVVMSTSEDDKNFIVFTGVINIHPFPLRQLLGTSKQQHKVAKYKFSLLVAITY